MVRITLSELKSLQSMIPCNSTLPKSAFLTITDTSSGMNVTCSANDVIEVIQNKEFDTSVAIQTVFDCELLLHTTYSGLLSLYEDSTNQKYLGEISGLLFSELCSMILCLLTMLAFL